jgi:NAD(P)-dependent dehydrogenase (short-subunit alcohol dehydrogenase family)
MSTNNKWTAADMPDLTGKIVVVTGGNSGIGFDAVRAFAQKGARTIMASRNPEKGALALAEIQAELPTAPVELMELDLANLEAIHRFAAEFQARYAKLHILVNNAGVMALPYRTTADGFEMQFGTNHLGHFALTGVLLETILGSEASRIVTISSGAHSFGQINFDDLNGRESYSKWGAYGQSKLANLLFAYELQRKLAATAVDTISVAAHPGYSATNLQHVGPEMAGSSLQRIFMAVMNRLFAQSQEMGALPTLYAATSSAVQGGDYIGPDGFREMRGYPTKVSSNEASRDQAAARRLWAVSEELTGVRYNFLESQG